MKAILSSIDEVDLRKYPEITPSSDMTEVSVGDLHANVLYLLNILVRQGIVAISPEQYDRFVSLYTHLDFNTTRIWDDRQNKLVIPPAPVFQENFKGNKQKILTEARKEFDEILKTILVVDIRKRVRLIGDELADRGVNDYFMLAFIRHLDEKDATFEILLSNHGIEFIEACERFKKNGKKLVAARMNDNRNGNSFYALNETIKAGVVSHEEVLNIYDKIYKKHLKILSYSLDAEANEIQVFSHAGIGLQHIRGLANKLGCPYSDQNAAALAKTIDEINTSFKVKAEQNEIHTLYTSQMMLDGLEGNFLDAEEEVVAATVWGRCYDDLERSSPNFKVVFIHGHDKHDNSEEHITLNQGIGQFTRCTGTMRLYLTNPNIGLCENFLGSPSCDSFPLSRKPGNDLETVRHYPNSYQKIWDEQTYASDLNKAKALLKDYTKESFLFGGFLGRFFMGHWNRHHVSAVSQLLQSVNDLNEMMAQLKALNPRKGGSLDRRISFIEDRIQADFSLTHTLK